MGTVDVGRDLRRGGRFTRREVALATRKEGDE